MEIMENRKSFLSPCIHSMKYIILLIEYSVEIEDTWFFVSLLGLEGYLSTVLCGITANSCFVLQCPSTSLMVLEVHLRSTGQNPTSLISLHLCKILGFSVKDCPSLHRLCRAFFGNSCFCKFKLLNAEFLAIELSC